MDDRELERRGPQLLLGAAALTVGGLLVLLDLQYATTGNALAKASGRNLALLMGVPGLLLGLLGSWCYRGSIPMVLVGVVIALCGLVALHRVLLAF